MREISYSPTSLSVEFPFTKISKWLENSVDTNGNWGLSSATAFFCQAILRYRPVALTSMTNFPGGRKKIGSGDTLAIRMTLTLSSNISTMNRTNIHDAIVAILLITCVQP